MPLKPQALTQRDFVQMVDTLDIQSPHPMLIENAHIEMGEIVTRFGWKKQSATTTGTAGTTGNGGLIEWVTSAGTLTRVCVQNGQIYTLDTGLVPTLAVSVTNLASATVTLAASTPCYLVPFDNLLVVSDGTNTPFTWDGTSGAGGLTKLTNAPVFFGPPTVYYARLFGILASDHSTIQWSEVNSPNTGYVAGGFNNQWTLSQTGQQPLMAIVGTNEALYYWRLTSIGAIRGAVTATFSSDGTHDGISSQVGHNGLAGTGAYRGFPLFFNDSIYFSDQAQHPWRIRKGGQLEPLFQNLPRDFWNRGGSTVTGAKPFNMGEAGYTNPGYTCDIVAWPTYNFVLYFTNPSAPQTAPTYVFSDDTGKLAGLYRFQNIIGRCAPMVVTATSGGLSALVGTTGNTISALASFGTSLQYGADDDSSTSTSFVTTVIGPAQGYTELGEWSFDEIEPVFDTNAADSGALVKVDYITNQQHYSTLVSAQQQVTAYDASYNLKEQRARFGINGNGAWIRVRVQLSSTGRLALKGWTVKGYLVPGETSVVA